MATITVPFKTPLGNEELRTRVHKLGQRHRTILFLIDGRRPLAEVLSLAHQAGAATSHFEDLLRMGLVALPPESPLTPPPREIPTLADEAKVTSVDMVVLEEVVKPPDSASIGPAPVLEPAPPPVEIPVPVQHPPLPTPDLQETPEDHFERTIRQFPQHLPTESPEGPFERTQQFPHPTPVALPTPAASRPESFKAPLAKGPTTTVPVLNQPIWSTPAPLSQEPRQEPIDVAPPPEYDEAEVLQQIRDLLADALRLDAPLFSARTFMRVRGAQSMGELITLLWEIEDHLSHKRRSRRELQSLQRARELLGLGNTLVGGDNSRPADFDEK